MVEHSACSFVRFSASFTSLRSVLDYSLNYLVDKLEFFDDLLVYSGYNIHYWSVIGLSTFAIV